MQGAKRAGVSFLEYLQSGRDMTSTTVFVEDFAAVVGVSVASVALHLAQRTGLMTFDAIGSIAIGGLLCAISVFLIKTNRDLLIGRAMGNEERAQVLDLLRCDPVVAAVYDTKSEEFGPGVYRFKAEVEFTGDQVVRRFLDRAGRARLLADMRACAVDDETMERALREFGKDVLSASGAEIDRIEQEIKRAVPGLRHVDIETDRGRFRTRNVGPLVREQEPNSPHLPDLFKELPPATTLEQIRDDAQSHHDYDSSLELDMDRAEEERLRRAAGGGRGRWRDPDDSSARRI